LSPNSLTLETETPITSSYQWSAVLPNLDPQALASARTANLSDSLLQLPVLPDRVSELARQITEGKDNDFQRLEAIRQHLLTNYTYDLENTAPPPGQDGVDYFLFEDRRGVCTSFSSAFVVLARSIGIPARIVGGWAVSPTADLQPVRAFQAHQWAEVPFEGLGWVTFDATPGGPTSRVILGTGDDGGGGGGGGGGEDGAGTEALPLIFVDTITEITDISETRILKGSSVFVSGTVTDLQGLAVPGVTMTITAEDGQVQSATTGPTGTYRFEGLAPARYRIGATLVGFGTLTREAVLDARTPVSIDFVLRPSYTEAVVVSAGRNEQTLLTAPATVTVKPKESSIEITGALACLGTSGPSLHALHSLSPARLTAGMKRAAISRGPWEN
ncbi:MAG: transglutaminase domain-containing protein, partial [Acidobacteria bacterium]|nr:transglutaminase domain-containing protein [Acidobacteriota bacterium]